MNAQPASGSLSKSSFSAVFSSVSSLAALAALSYSFSYEVFATGVIGGFVDINQTGPADLNCADRMSNCTAILQAANTVMMSFMNSIAVLSACPLFSIAALISAEFGKLENPANSGEDNINEYKLRISSSMRDTLIFTIFILSPLAFFPLYYSSSLLKVLGQNSAVAEVAETFLRPMAPAVIALLLQVALEQIIYGFKKIRTAMLVGLVSLALAIAFALLLGIGYGLPNLGLPGIAYACLAGLSFSVVSYASVLIFDKSFKEYQFLNFSRLPSNQFSFLKDIFKESGPLLISYLNEVSVAICLSIFSGLIGGDAQSQLSFIMQFFYFVLIPSTAFGQICWQELSRLIHKSSYEDAQALARWGLVTSAIWMGIACAIAAVIYAGMNATEGSQQIPTFILFALAIWIDSMRFNMLQQQRAFADSSRSTLISVLCLSTGIGASALLGLFTEWRNLGLGAGYLLGASAAVVAMFPRWWKFSAAQTIQQRQESKADVSEELQPSRCQSRRCCLFSRRRSQVVPSFNEPLLPRQA